MQLPVTPSFTIPILHTQGVLPISLEHSDSADGIVLMGADWYVPVHVKWVIKRKTFQSARTTSFFFIVSWKLELIQVFR